MLHTLFKLCRWRHPKRPGRYAIRAATLPRLTTNAELLKLMTNEFHKPGSKTLDTSELGYFRLRLTCQQLSLLSRIPKNRLTGFITFGD